MKTINVKLDEKEFNVVELLAIDFDYIAEIEDSKGKVKSLISKSTNMTDSDFNKLTVRERSKIMEVINELNGWNEDFQKPQEEEKQE